MSMHEMDHPPGLIEALKRHGLKHDTPSQLSDAFRLGWLAAPSAPAEQPAEPALEEPTETAAADIGQVLDGMMRAFDEDYARMSEADLEKRWYFRFDPASSTEANIYAFHDMLGLYQRACRRWEEIHNGHTCVVERVRDKYLMPKIREFAASLRAHPELAGAEGPAA